MQAFGGSAESEAWLAPLLRKPPRMGETERRHARRLLGASTIEGQAVPASLRGDSSRYPAA
jgi:hypothetical protein